MQKAIVAAVAIAPFLLRTNAVPEGYQSFGRQINSAGPKFANEAQAEAAYSAMCGATSSTAGQQALAADINNFIAHEKAMTATFANVSTQLQSIDDELGTATFTPTWNTLQQQLSQVHADYGNAGYNYFAYVDQFADLYMTWAVDRVVQSPTNLTDAMFILQQVTPAAIESLLQGYAQTTSSDLSTLKQGFNDFYDNFSKSSVVQSTSVVSRASDGITNVVAQADNQLIDIAGALDAGLFLDAGALNLLPQFSSVVLSAGSQATGADAGRVEDLTKQKSAAQGKIATSKGNMSAQAESAANQVLATLDGLQNDLDQFSAMADGLNAILNYLRYDRTRLASFLPQVQNGTTSQIQPWIYWQTLPKTNCRYNVGTCPQTVPTCLYDSLQTALLGYMSGGSSLA